MKKLTKAMLAMGAATLAVMVLPSQVTAQEYPSKPIKILIPFPPGGGTDFVSRLVGNKLAEITKWSVILENKPGAGGNLAIAEAAKANPDGYTLVMGQTDNMMLGPWLYSNIGYDSVKSFAPVVQVSVTPGAVVSATNSDIKNASDLLKKSKSADGVKWATAGNGTFGHLLGEQYKKLSGGNITHIPYKGASPALTDLMGGHVDVAVLSVASVLPQIRTGKLNPVAVSTAQRSPQLPDTPTLQEGGVPGIDASIWVGMFAPAGTPPDVINKLNAAVNQALASQDVKDKITAGGVTVVGGKPEDFAEFVKKDYARWGAIAKESGVKVQ